MKAYGDIAPLNVKVIRDFKGMDRRGIFNIPENSFAWLYDITTEYYPEIRTRKGVYTTGSITGSVANGLGSWKNSELHCVMSGNWQKYNGTTWTSIASGLNSSAYCSFTNFQGNLAAINLLMANGVDPVKKYDGTTVSNLLNAPSGITYIDSHDNRVYGAAGNTVYFSALRKPEDWTTVNDAGSITVESPDGESIIGIRSGLQHLLIFKPNSMYELYGTGPANYRLVQVSEEVGIQNHRCSVTLNGMVYFLHRTGFYRYSGGSQPDKSFSQHIQPLIDRMSTTASYGAVGTDGNCIYVTIYSQGTDSNPFYTLQFNPQYGLWSVYFRRAGSTYIDFKDFEFMNGKFYGLYDGQVLDMKSSFSQDRISNSLAPSSIFGIVITRAINANALFGSSRYLRLFYSYISTALPSVQIYMKTEVDDSESNWTFYTSDTNPIGQLVNARYVFPNDTFQKNKYILLKFNLGVETRLIDIGFETIGKPLA